MIKRTNQRSTVLIVILAFVFCGCSITKSQVREKIEWSEFWWENESDISKPRVLFIGNSITKGYFHEVSRNLSGVVNCDKYVSSRSITDPALFKETKMALGKYNHRIILFNNGLHGWHLDSIHYERGLRKYVKFLKAHKSKGCKIVYSLTTPYPSKEAGVKLDPEKNGVVMERNRIARKIMEENDIPVIDLYGLIEPEIEEYSISKGNVHYKDEGYKKLAGIIRKKVLELLE